MGLREVRIEKGFTRTRLARESGLSETTVWKAEREVTIRDTSFGAIASALGLSTAELRAAMDDKESAAA
jgi:transcriptional regulator with XRE-family HTH domain